MPYVGKEESVGTLAGASMQDRYHQGTPQYLQHGTALEGGADIGSSTANLAVTLAVQHDDPDSAAKRLRLDNYAGDQPNYACKTISGRGPPATACATTAMAPTFVPSPRASDTSGPDEATSAAVAHVPITAPIAPSSVTHAPELHWHYASRTTSSSTSRAFALVGSYISVRWDGDQHWYAGSIDAFDKEKQMHHICYQDDGTDEWLRLDSVRHRLHPNPVQSYKDGQGEDLRGGADWRRLQYQDTFPTSKYGSKEDGNTTTATSNIGGIGGVGDSGGGGGSGDGGGSGSRWRTASAQATPLATPAATAATTAATATPAWDRCNTDDEPPAAPPSPTPEDLEQPELAETAAATAVATFPSVATAVAASLDENFGHPYQDVICLSTKEFTSYMKNNAPVLSPEIAAKIRRFRKSYMEKIRVQNLKFGEHAVNADSSSPARQAPSNWVNSQNKDLEPKQDPPLDVEGGYIPDHNAEVPLVFAEGDAGGGGTSFGLGSVVRPHDRQVALLPDVVLVRLEETDDLQSEILGFVRIQKNIYLNRALGKQLGSPSESVENDVCQCTLPADAVGLGCGPESECLNRTLQIECDPKTCPCGERCGNQQLKKGQSASVEIVSSTISGFGLCAVARLNPGDFVYEYLGEMIDNAEFNKRKEGYHERGDQHFYFMNVDGNEVIDATEKGALSRFINHSCDPNCEMQKWITGGKARMAIFASKPIEPGQEITFDYKLERFGDVARACLCGSRLCQKVFGKEKSVRGSR